MPFILMYWKQILYAVCAAAVATLLYWYGYHIPSKLKDVQGQLHVAMTEVERGKQAIILLDEIQKGKGMIDAITYKRISSIKSGLPANTVIFGNRVSVPSMPQTKAP